VVSGELKTPPLGDSSKSSGGAWPIVGGALLSFTEVVRSEVKLRIPLIERSDLEFLPAVRPEAPVRRIPLDYSVMEKDLLGKDLQVKGHPARLLSAQDTPGSAHLLTWPRLNLRTWNSSEGWVIRVLLG